MRSAGPSTRTGPSAEAGPGLRRDGDSAADRPLDRPFTGARHRSRSPGPRPAASGPAAGARRRIRAVETKTVFLFSLLFYSSFLVVLLVAGVLVWEAAAAAGAVHNLQHLVVSLGFSSLGHLGARLLRFAVFAGLVMVAIGTLLNVIGAVVFNLVSDVVGGIGVVVTDEEPSRPVV